MTISDAERLKVEAGRSAVDVYRDAHAQLHEKSYYRAIHADHTPLLEQLIDGLDKVGFTSTESDFISKKTEILANFFDTSDLENIKELGFENKADFKGNATKEDKLALREMWK